MNKSLIAAVAATTALFVGAAPMAAQAQQRVYVCDNVKKKANTGTVVGAVGGGLLGNVVAGGGNKTEGTLLGAGVGAVVGHQIAKKNAKKNCRYVYR